MATSPAQPDDATPPSGSFEVPVAADSPTSFSAQPPPSPPPVAPPPSAPPDPHSKGMQSWVVAFGILATVLITLLAISLLYYKWYKADDFDTTIVVWAPIDWKGATVEVTGAGLPTPGLAEELSDAEHMLIRFHVPPGAYSVRVSRDGQTLAERVTVRPLAAHMIWWPFRNRLVTTATTTRAGQK